MTPIPDIPEDLQAAITAVAYGDGSWTDRIRVALAARRDPAVRRELRAHRRVRAAVRALPPQPTPAGVAAGVDRRIAPVRPPRLLPALAVPAVAGAALLLAWLLQPASRGPQTGYTRAQVEEARVQLVAAFARVDHSLAKAGTAVHRDVLAPRVAHPIQGGTHVLHELFGKEK